MRPADTVCCAHGNKDKKFTLLRAITYVSAQVVKAGTITLNSIRRPQIPASAVHARHQPHGGGVHVEALRVDKPLIHMHGHHLPDDYG